MKIPNLESGERVQDALVAIANGMGDCDDAADLAEIVYILDRLEQGGVETPCGGNCKCGH